jgi:hypothetical protein
MRAFTILFFAALSVSLVVAQTTKTSTPLKPLAMNRFEGTPIKTDLGFNITLNKGSSLKREWFVIVDENCPVVIEDPAGVNVNYSPSSRTSPSEYQYSIQLKLRGKEPIAAVEVRVHVLDVFGRLLKTLSATEVYDFDDLNGLASTWRISNESEASEAFASVAYIAQVRTAKGKVYEIDKSAVFEQVRKVTKRITESDLEPKR